MSNIQAKHLLRNHRFTKHEWKFVSLLCYLPIGTILFILRLILALIAILLGCILPDVPVARKVINKIICLSLGINIIVENIDKLEDTEVYISNSVSPFDNLVVHNVTGSISPGLELQSLLSKSMGIYNFGSPTNLEAFKLKVFNVVSNEKVSLYFTPEEKSTNGKAILKFNTYPFKFGSKVQPICLTVDRPILDISIDTLGSSFWTDIIFYMFSPLTHYRLSFLPSLEKKNVNIEEFAEIVRRNIATGLKVEAVDMTAYDLLEWEKRQLAEQRRVPNSSSNTSLRLMALQVKEVLPHVPVDVISRDLWLAC